MRRSSIVSVAVVLSVTVAAPSAPAVTTDRWTECDTWTVVGTPDPTTLAGYEDVATADPWHAYAVGWRQRGPHSRAPLRGIAAVWDGWRWSGADLEVPDDPDISWQLWGVAARSSDDVWAVGVQGRRPLVERFDGSAWRIVPVPYPRGRSWLEAVTVVPGTRAVWAVGTRVWEREEFPLALRWTGTRWVRPPMPVGGRGLRLHGVTAVGREAWAVGSFGHYSDGPVIGPGILRWTGETWIRSRIPSVPGGMMESVAAGGPTDVLAVGWGSSGDAVVLRWDGERWARVGAARIPGLGRFSPMDVAYSSAGDAWVVGGFDLPGYHEWSAPAAYHRVGGAWSRTMLETPEGAAFPLGVDAGTPHDVWVVGEEGGYQATPFAQHRC